MSESTSRRNGLLSAAAAYGLWGLLPAYFVALGASGAVEILAWRIVLSLIFCVVILVAMRGITRTIRLLRSRRVVLWSVLGAALIFINWAVYVYASLNQFIVEAALGYFINPLVTVGLGVVVLQEKLRLAQWLALGLALVAVVVLAVGYGSIPYISLILAFSFGFYGFVKNRVGPGVRALDSLTLETLWLTPIALGLLVWVSVEGGVTLGTLGPGHTALLLMAGAVTSIPLLFFGAAASRLPLSVLGLMQYLAPILQFLFGVVVMNEPMPPERWVGFSLVWIALVFLSADGLRHRRDRVHSPAGH